MKNKFKIIIPLLIVTIVITACKISGIKTTDLTDTPVSSQEITVTTDIQSAKTEENTSTAETKHKKEQPEPQATQTTSERQTSETASKEQAAQAENTKTESKINQAVQEAQQNSETAETLEEIPRPLKSLETEVIDLLNEEREKEGIAPLIADDTLYTSVVLRANECEEYWSHTRPNGEKWHTVYTDAYQYNIRLAGENLARKFESAEQIVNKLMASEGHRNNILNPKFTHVCVAIITMKPIEEYPSHTLYAMAQHFYQKEETI